MQVINRINIETKHSTYAVRIASKLTSSSGGPPTSGDQSRSFQVGGRDPEMCVVRTVRNLPPHRWPRAPMLLCPSVHVRGEGIEGLVESSKQQRSVSAGMKLDVIHFHQFHGHCGSSRTAVRPAGKRALRHYGKSQLVPSSLTAASTTSADVGLQPAQYTHLRPPTAVVHRSLASRLLAGSSCSRHKNTTLL